MRRTSLMGAECPVARSLDVIGDWWSLLIVRDASRGLTRFGEFQKSLGLAKNILSARLKKLVEHGILRAEPGEHGSARRAYVLTEKGTQLSTILLALWQWGEEHCFPDDQPAWSMVDKAAGESLAHLQPRTTSGRALGPADFALVARNASS